MIDPNANTPEVSLFGQNKKAPPISGRRFLLS